MARKNFSLTNEDEGNERANLRGINYLVGKAVRDRLDVPQGRLPSRRAQHPDSLAKKVRKFKIKTSLSQENINAACHKP